MLRGKQFHCREGRGVCSEPPNFSTSPHFCVNYSSHYKTGCTWRNQSTVAQSKKNKSLFQSRSKMQENLRVRLQEEPRGETQACSFSCSPGLLDVVAVLLNTSNKWRFESSHVRCSWAFLEEELEMGLLLVVEMKWCHLWDLSAQWMGICPHVWVLLCRGAALCTTKTLGCTLGLENSS